MKSGSITRQAGQRLILSLGLFVLLLGLSSYALYSFALQKSARERTEHLAAFYQARLMQLDSEWELQTRDFKNRLEFPRLLEDRKTGEGELQAFMTVQGASQRFQHMLIQNRDGDRIFVSGNAPDIEEIPFLSGQERGWYRSKEGGNLYRVFVVPVWLGASGNGRMAVFYQIDNALLFNLATPGIVLTAMSRDNPIASSAGQAGLDGAKRPGDVEGREIPWSADDAGSATLRIDAPIKALFTRTELALGAAAIPVVDGLILWFTLGFWLMGNSRRIRSLGGAVEEFAANNRPTAALEEKLGDACGGRMDEISEVARAIEDMAEQTHRLRFQSEALLRRNQTLMQNSMDGIHVLDIRGDIVEANDAFCRMLGYTQAEMAGLNVADFDAQWTAEELQARLRALIGKSAKFETVHRRKDGSLIDVEISVNGMEIDGQCFMLAASHDITHRKHAEQAQRESERRKDEFLAMLAHELRNPLVPIRNAAHVIGRLGLDEPKIKWAQELIEGQVSHLARMVDDLLDVSRIAQGKITLLREEVELGELIGKLMPSIGPLAESKGQALSLHLPERTIWLQGDAVRLSQVLFNLVDNAVKYTPEGGHIELAARMEGQEVEISVRDNGMGITAELLPRVFDLFRQDERTLERAKGGLGIGLTLVQRLVEMHGGRVVAHSAGAGQGSTFTVWLPAKVMPGRTVVPGGSKSAPAVGVRVMVVDDDRAVSDSTAMLLELEGHTVCVADTGQSALEQMPAFRPQVVLLDIGMKDMDGFEIVKRLRALPEGRDLCVVAVTGYADEKTRELALASGFTYFMVKPVSFELFRDLLARQSGMARNPA